MPGIKFERRTLPPSVGGNTGTEQGIGQYEAGSRVCFRCRSAEALINVTSAPSLRSWEGPYLRVRPAWGNTVANMADNVLGNNKKGRGIIARAGESYVFASGTTVIPAGADEIFYELDVLGQSALYIPFDCSLSFYSDNAMNYVFDVWEIPPGRNMPPGYRQEVSQTRAVATGETRSLTVPFGAMEVSFSGTATGAVIFSPENVGKTVGLGTSSTSFTPGAARDRFPCSGVRSLLLTPAAASTVTFWITL